MIRNQTDVLCRCKFHIIKFRQSQIIIRIKHNCCHVLLSQTATWSLAFNLRPIDFQPSIVCILLKTFLFLPNPLLRLRLPFSRYYNYYDQSLHYSISWGSTILLDINTCYHVQSFTHDVIFWGRRQSSKLDINSVFEIPLPLTDLWVYAAHEAHCVYVKAKKLLRSYCSLHHHLHLDNLVGLPAREKT